MSSFSLTHWIILLGVVAILVMALKPGRGKPNMICRNCGHTGDAKIVTKGSLIVEIFLWMLFIIPGVIYSMWRMSSKYDACKACGCIHIIPQNSPIGKKLAADNASTVARVDLQNR
mgnify:CR=1 FL=1